MVKKRIVSQSTYVDPSKAGQKKAAGTRKVYRGTLEAQWECNACGRTGIPGRLKRCPGCGRPKTAGEEYEAPAGKAAYLSAEELKEMGVDPTLHLSDEECDFCGSKLKPGTQRCLSCGAALGDVGYTTHTCPACGRESNAEQCPACGAPTEEKLVAHRYAEPPPKQESKRTPFWRQRQFFIPAFIIFTLTCLCACFAIFSNIRRMETATVTDIAWERTIAIEEHQYVERGDWSLPANTDLVSQEERISGYNQVQIGNEERCGYEESCTTISVYSHTERTCYDDGTCDDHDVYRDERQCTSKYVCNQVPIYENVPIYRTWYVYNAWEWVTIRSAVARGSTIDIYWPEVRLEDNQREGKRSERCTVTFTNTKGNAYPYRPPCAELRQYPLRSRWNIKRNTNEVLEVQPEG